MQSSRHDIPHHFTASGLVIEQGHILLVNHKRIGAWVPPGGHIEPDELPEETVVREILEETGVSVAVISKQWAPNDDPDAFFLLQPLFMQAVLAVLLPTGCYLHLWDPCWIRVLVMLSLIHI